MLNKLFKLDKMCEKRTRKIKKGSHLTRLRENRRLQRLQWLASPVPSEDLIPPPCPQPVDKVAQNRVLLELAWKTVALMQKNKLIQQKIIALQKETSEFVAAVMSNPENRDRYLAQIRLQQEAQKKQMKPVTYTLPLKIESNM